MDPKESEKIQPERLYLPITYKFDSNGVIVYEPQYFDFSVPQLKQEAINKFRFAIANGGELAVDDSGEGPSLFKWKSVGENIRAELHYPKDNICIAQEECFHLFDEIARGNVTFPFEVDGTLRRASRDATHFALISDWLLTRSANRLGLFEDLKLESKLAWVDRAFSDELKFDVSSNAVSLRFQHTIDDDYIERSLKTHLLQINEALFKSRPKTWGSEFKSPYNDALQLYLLSYGEAYYPFLTRLLEYLDSEFTGDPDSKIEKLKKGIEGEVDSFLNNIISNADILSQFLSHYNPMSEENFINASAVILNESPDKLGSLRGKYILINGRIQDIPRINILTSFIPKTRTQFWTATDLFMYSHFVR